MRVARAGNSACAHVVERVDHAGDAGRRAGGCAIERRDTAGNIGRRAASGIVITLRVPRRRQRLVGRRVIDLVDHTRDVLRLGVGASDGVDVVRVSGVGRANVNRLRLLRRQPGDRLPGVLLVGLRREILAGLNRLEASVLQIVRDLDGLNGRLRI